MPFNKVGPIKQIQRLKTPQKTVISMEGGAVDTTVIAGGQHKMG